MPHHLLAQTSVGYNALTIPPLETGELIQNKRTYRLSAQHGNQSFLEGLNTPTLGINGDFLGPTLVLHKDEFVALQVRNQLREPTALHWHGLHVPAIADGGPHQQIEPGESWMPEFRVLQDAGTFWYHSHMMEHTGDQVNRGLAGLIIIEDEKSAGSSLPHDYGVDDIPVIVQDRRFNEDGSFAYTLGDTELMTGFFGDTILVNGTVNPLFSPSTTKVRFRLLNGANARLFVFAFDDGRQFDVVSSDGGLLNAPMLSNNVILSPGERADIIVDFSDGTGVNLISEPLADDSPFAPRSSMRAMLPDSKQAVQILAIEPQSNLQVSVELAGALAAIPRIQEAEAVRVRSMTLSMIEGIDDLVRRGQGVRDGDKSGGHSFINDQLMDMDIINQRISVGDTEIWELINLSHMMHPFHIHHNQFQILSRDGRPPFADEMGFKDTVKVGPGEIVRIIMRFENFADAEHPYMYHCHILEHEDDGMMGQFVVE